jgi:hypothetical protein
VVTSWGGLPTLGVMPRELPDEVLNLLGYQAGVLSRGQAQRAGMTGKQIDTAARSGRWQRLHAGVYAAFTGQPRRVTLLRAAVLRAGPKAVLSQHSAAELQGLLATPVPAIHVMVPTGSQVAPIHGVVLHYSSLVTRERHPALRPPQTRVEETVLDLAGSAASLDEALCWIFRACGSRRTTAGRITSAMARRARMRWRTELTAALGLGADGVHSLLEFRYVNRVERPHGLPVATRQFQVTRAGRHQYQYQDVTYQPYGVVVELDGRVAHPVETPMARHPPGQRQQRRGPADAQVRVGRRDRAAMPDRRSGGGACWPSAAGTGGFAAAVPAACSHPDQPAHPAPGHPAHLDSCWPSIRAHPPRPPRAIA